MSPGLKVAVVEPTELMGAEIIRVLEERGFPISELRLLGSHRATGEQVDFGGTKLTVRRADSASFRGVDLSFFACDRVMSGELAGAARSAGAVVIDLSPRHALEDDVPLVVPEVNARDIGRNHGVIACPRAATVQLVLTLAPIHRAVRIRGITVTSLHPVSEIGVRAMDELTGQVRDIFSFRETSGNIFPRQMAFNVIPMVGTPAEGGYTDEELAVAAETRKILKDREIHMSVTCVRVPVFFSHAMAVIVETERKMTAVEARKVLEKAPGVAVEDEPAAGLYPTQVQATGMDECLVGRIRADLGHDNGIALWTVCDNMRKGSALNAVQIAEHLFRTRI